MISRLRQRIASANFGIVGLEFFLLVAGILIAFQIDRWAEERREREQEYQYLIRLKDDLESEIDLMVRGIEFAAEQIENVRMLEIVGSNPELARSQPKDFVMAIELVTWTSFPQVSGNVFTELKTTGNLSLLQSAELRQALADHYSIFRHFSIIAQDHEIQNLFTQLTAGLLGTDELLVIQQNKADREKLVVTPERAYEVALEFSDRKQAIALLPSIAQFHGYIQTYVGLSLDDARRLVATLDGLIRDSNRG
jgi:hypothetical protein